MHRPVEITRVARWPLWWSTPVRLSPAAQRTAHSWGWGIPARVRPSQPGSGRGKASWDNEPLLIAGRSDREGPLRTNDSVNIRLSRSTNPGLLAQVRLECPAANFTRNMRMLSWLVLTEADIPLGRAFLLFRKGGNEAWEVGFPLQIITHSISVLLRRPQPSLLIQQRGNPGVSETWPFFRS